MGAIGGLLLSVKTILEIAMMIFKYLNAYYIREERGQVAKELKDSVQAAIDTGDTTRINQLLNPDSAPFPRTLK